jgi:hypothetical protein
MAQILINTAAAVTTTCPEFSVLRGFSNFPTLIASGFGVGDDEYAQLQINQNGTWVNVALSGVMVRLSATQTVMPIDITGRYRLTKPLTAGVVVITFGGDVETSV